MDVSNIGVSNIGVLFWGIVLGVILLVAVYSWFFSDTEADEETNF